MAEVWKMYLKPREVSTSRYDSVSIGKCARSVTSLVASVSVLKYEPLTATMFG